MRGKGGPPGTDRKLDRAQDGLGAALPGEALRPREGPAAHFGALPPFKGGPAQGMAMDTRVPEAARSGIDGLPERVSRSLTAGPNGA